MDVQHRVEARLCPRFKLDANLKIHSGTELLSGYALDISESGISAMLPIEVLIGEIVDLDFELPGGPVSVRAVVRERNAFRYGFPFMQPNAAHQLIADACGSLPPCDQLDLEESISSCLRILWLTLLGFCCNGFMRIQLLPREDEGQFENYISVFVFFVRSLGLDWNSKLSIRMVAGFAELAERKEFFGCGGRYYRLDNFCGYRFAAN